MVRVDIKTYSRFTGARVQRKTKLPALGITVLRVRNIPRSDSGPTRRHAA
jgi:hypothetical protein